MGELKCTMLSGRNQIVTAMFIQMEKMKKINENKRKLNLYCEIKTVLTRGEV